MIKVGDKIPSFTAKDLKGDDFEIQNYIGKKPLVIYFYPKDNTAGCTIQACSFRDQYQDFTDLGAEVIGISSDSVTSHQKFQEDYKLPFVLLSDENQKIRNLFGVPKGLLGLVPGRVTYVIDQDGIVKMIFDNGLMVKKHISKALDAIKNIVK